MKHAMLKKKKKSNGRLNVPTLVRNNANGPCDMMIMSNWVDVLYSGKPPCIFTQESQ